jgi:NAD(P)-dependent dehydrogenase (short-subunit alcohol dehydrogenase family)
VFIITGGAGGIGRAIAAELLEAGGRVAISGRGAEALAEAEAELGRPGDVLPVRTDVADRAQADLLVERTVERFGRLDGLVCSHGVAPSPKRFVDWTDEDWAHVISINLLGVVHVSRAAVGRLMEQGMGGSIVLISSVNGLRAEPGWAPYNTSKGAVQSLAQSMASDLASSSIRVNAVAPGWILTPMTAEHAAGLEDAELEGNMLGRIGRPREISTLVAFLLGQEASFITGQTIVADGGQTSQLAPFRVRRRPRPA